MIDARNISSSVIVWLVDLLELEAVRDVSQYVNQFLLLQCRTQLHLVGYEYPLFMKDHIISTSATQLCSNDLSFGCWLK